MNHPPSHSTIPYSPTLITSETLASILIPPFPLTPIIYICTNPSTTTYTASDQSDVPFPSPSLLLLPPPTSSPYSTIATPLSLTSLNTNYLNDVVRCVHLLPRRSSECIKPLLKQLHWLPVPYGIKYKLSLTIHKDIHHNSPDYIASLLHLHTPITPLQTRSSNTFILTTPHLHKLHYSNIRSFAISATYHWNSLPNHLRTNTSTHSFKRHLKTYYFSLAFPPTQ